MWTGDPGEFSKSPLNFWAFFGKGERLPYSFPFGPGGGLWALPIISSDYYFVSHQGSIFLSVYAEDP